MREGYLISGVAAYVLSAFCAYSQVLEVSVEAAVRQTARAVQAERADDAADLQDALVTASAAQKAQLVEQYVARDRERVAELRARREASPEPVLVDRSVGIEDAVVRAAIQVEDQAIAGGVALVESMKTLSSAEATKAFLAWEQSPEREVLVPIADGQVSRSLPVLEEWVAAEDASLEEKELASAHNRLNARILNCVQSSANLSPQAQTEAFLFFDQQIRADRETIRQSRNPTIEPTNETHD